MQVIKNEGTFSTSHILRNNGKIFSVTAYEKTEYEMMAFLVEKTKEAGHQLTFAEAAADPEMIQPNEFPRCTYFHSFDEAAEAAWVELNPKPPLKEGESCLTEKGRKLVAYLREHPTPKPALKPFLKQVSELKQPKGPIPRFD